MRGWIARVKVPLCAKFGDPSSKGVGARGQKAEMQKCALRAHFCTLGAVRPHGTQVRPRPFWPESLGSRRPPVWAAAVLEFFAYFLRGGTWRVTRDTWRHVTTPSSFPISGASFETSAGRIGFADPALLTKVFGHTDTLTH